MRIDNQKLNAKSYYKLHQALVHLYGISLLEETSATSNILSIKLDLPTNEKSRIRYVNPFIKKSVIEKIVGRVRELKHKDLIAISYLYRAGLGLPKDEVLSEIWFNFAHKTITVVDEVEVDIKKCIKRLRKHLKSIEGDLAYLQDYVDQAGYLNSSTNVRGKHSARTCVAVPIPLGIDATFIYSKQLDGSYALYAVANSKFGMLERILSLSATEGSKLGVPTKISPKLKSSYVAVVTRAVANPELALSTGSEEVNETYVLKQAVLGGSVSRCDYTPDLDRQQVKSLLSDVDFSILEQRVLDFKKKSKGKKVSSSHKAVYKADKKYLAAQKKLRALAEIDKLNKNKKLPAECLTYYAYDFLVGKGIDSFRSPRVDYERLTRVIIAEGFNMLPSVSCKSNAIDIKALKLKFDLDFSNVLTRTVLPKKGTSDIAYWAMHKV